MSIVITGSIALDQLLTYPGRFTDHLLPEALHTVSLSFLVDAMVVRYGGAAANIAYGLGRAGLRPLLVGAAGLDFAEYRAWLEKHGVDTGLVRVSAEAYTARFVCTTDAAQNQIASFYPGAMREAAGIDLVPVLGVPGSALVLVGPDDPDAMVRHGRACRQTGTPYLADPSQQLARLTGEQVRDLVTGAAFLLTNEYEHALLRERTGWGAGEVLDHVGVWITTLGANGVRIERRGDPLIRVPAVPAIAVTDPTGVGDAFRAGLLTAQVHGLSLERSAQLGTLFATLCLERSGAQHYAVSRCTAYDRLRGAYGHRAAADLAGVLTP